MVQHTDMDQIWIVVTPHNPHKTKKSLADNYDRLHMVNLAIEDNDLLRSSSIEFKLPQPSYTVDTLTYVSEKYPQHNFSLIMGGDNLTTFHKWKNYEQILSHYKIYVYKRPTYEVPELATHPSITLCEAPLLSISSSYIRQLIMEKKSIQYLVPAPVYKYLLDNPIYQRLMSN